MLNHPGPVLLSQSLREQIAIKQSGLYFLSSLEWESFFYWMEARPLLAGRSRAGPFCSVLDPRGLVLLAASGSFPTHLPHSFLPWPSQASPIAWSAFF